MIHMCILWKTDTFAARKGFFSVNENKSYGKQKKQVETHRTTGLESFSNSNTCPMQDVSDCNKLWKKCKSIKYVKQHYVDVQN